MKEKRSAEKKSCTLLQFKCNLQEELMKRIVINKMVIARQGQEQILNGHKMEIVVEYNDRDSGIIL